MLLFDRAPRTRAATTRARACPQGWFVEAAPRFEPTVLRSVSVSEFGPDATPNVRLYVLAEAGHMSVPTRIRKIKVERLAQVPGRVQPYALEYADGFLWQDILTALAPGP